MSFWERIERGFTHFFLFIRMKIGKKSALLSETEYFRENGKRRFLVRLRLILTKTACLLCVPVQWMRMGRIVRLQE